MKTTRKSYKFLIKLKRVSQCLSRAENTVLASPLKSCSIVRTNSLSGEASLGQSYAVTDQNTFIKLSETGHKKWILS